MNKIMLMLLCLVLLQAAHADTLTLQQAYMLAEQNYPAIKMKPLYDQATELRLKNLTAKYFPQISVNGQITYQSEVPEIPIPGLAALPKDHYQASLDLSQTLYDGGLVKANKNLEHAQHDIDMQSVTVDLYGVRNRVNTYFFTMLILQKRQEILDTSTTVLNTRLKQLQSGYKNGAVLESDMLKIQAELLKIGQTTSDNNASRQAITDALSVLLGKPVDFNTRFQMPSATEVQQTAERPELKLFALQQERIGRNNRVISANVLPKLSAFAQGGISYPNFYNFLDATTQPYYLVGAKLSWNLSGFYTSGKDRKLLSVQQQSIQVQRESFERNLALGAANEASEIKRLQELVKQDNEIITTYSKILKQSTSQLDNGTITVADFITDLNAENQARLNQQLHSVQLEQAKANYITNQGTTNLPIKK